MTEESDNVARRPLTLTLSEDEKHRCEFCGKVYYRPEMAPDPSYMEHGHLIMECEEVPEPVFKRLNGPPPVREP